MVRGEVFVDFATSDGTAVDGVNYSGVSTTVGFPPGEVLETVTVPILDDQVITPDLTVNLALSNPTPPADLGVQPNAVLTIQNSDSSVVSFCLESFIRRSRTSPAAWRRLTLSARAAPTAPARSDFYTTTNGTAVAGVDYIPTNETVVFNPGQSDVAVQVPLLNSSTTVGNTTVGLLLTNAVGTLLVDPSNAVLTIVNTTASPGQLSFASTNFVVNEGDGTAFLTVLRTNGSSGSVSVTYTTVPGTAQPGLNYTTVSGPLTFGNGEISKNIAVPLINNNVVQGPVSLSVVLSNPTGNATLITPTNTTLTINDNDVGITFVSATNYVSETNSSGTIFVQRIGATEQCHFGELFHHQRHRLCTGTNYTPVSGVLTFNIGGKRSRRLPCR